MMKTIALATLAFATASSSAMAQQVASTPFKWTGFYFGVHGGYAMGAKSSISVDAFNDKDTTDSDPNDEASARGSASQRRDDAFAGLHAGYNWQTSGLVVGIETDISFMDMSSEKQVAALTDVAGGQEFFYSYGTGVAKIDWFGTTRARVGYSFGTILPFVTGGIAYGKVTSKGTTLQDGSLGQGPQGHFCFVTINNNNPCTTGPVSGGHNDSSVRVGWTAGGGVDIALAQNFILNVTYVHVDLGSISSSSRFSKANANGSRIAVSNAMTDVDASFDTVRVGLSLKY